MLESDRVNELVSRKDRFGPNETVLKWKQTYRNDKLESTIYFPSVENYPKHFNTRTQKKDSLKYHQTNCGITGKPAAYRDPLTMQPYSNKEAFTII